MKTVVLTPVPTSNHNYRLCSLILLLLFLPPFLHQTTTDEWLKEFEDTLFLPPFLHQTTTVAVSVC